MLVMVNLREQPADLAELRLHRVSEVGHLEPRFHAEREHDRARALPLAVSVLERRERQKLRALVAAAQRRAPLLGAPLVQRPCQRHAILTRRRPGTRVPITRRVTPNPLVRSGHPPTARASRSPDRCPRARPRRDPRRPAGAGCAAGLRIPALLATARGAR